MSTWIKLLDTFPEHPSVLDLSDAAFRAHIEALCYCARNLTDGAMTATAVERRVGVKPKVVAELVEAGLWIVADGGFSVANYTKYQRSKEQIDKLRDGNRQRQAKRRSGATPDFWPPDNDAVTPMSRRDESVSHADVTRPDTDTETEADNPPTPLPAATRDGWGTDTDAPTRIADARARLRNGIA